MICILINFPIPPTIWVNDKRLLNLAINIRK